jgi:hypothetical protein
LGLALRLRVRRPDSAIRTREFLYIRNFKSDRWPAGDPIGLEQSGAQPFSFDELATETRAALADIDAGPTKAYVVSRRSDPGVKPFYDLAAGKLNGSSMICAKTPSRRATWLQTRATRSLSNASISD